MKWNNWASPVFLAHSSSLVKWSILFPLGPASTHYYFIQCPIMYPGSFLWAHTRSVHLIHPLAPVPFGCGTTAPNQMTVWNIHRRLLVSNTRRPPAQMIRGSSFSFSRWKPCQGSESFVLRILDAEQQRRVASDWFHSGYSLWKAL